MQAMAIKNRQQWFLKEWRKFRGYSQDRLAERVSGLSEFSLVKGDISNLEKGKRRYNQDLLEALAEALDVPAGYLVMINPLESRFWTIWEQASEGERKDIESLAEVVLQRRKAG